MKKMIWVLLLLTFTLMGCESKQNDEITEVLDNEEIVEVESEELEEVEDNVEDETLVVNRIELLEKIRILPERLNVREEHSEDSEVKAKVHKGAIYDIYQTQLVNNKIWYKISYDKDKFGWVAGWFTTELSKIYETDEKDFDHLVVKLNQIKSPYRLPDNISKLDAVLEVGELFEIYDNVIDEEGVLWYKINRNHIMDWIKGSQTEVFLSNKDYTISDDSVVVFEDPTLESIVRDTFNLDYDFIRYGDVKDIESLILNGNFTSLRGLEYFTSLKSLECDTESIKLFDLLKSNELESLKLRNAVIEDFDLIGHFSQLKHLDIIGCDIETLYPIRNLKRLSNISIDAKHEEDLNKLNMNQILMTTVNIELPELTVTFDHDVEVSNYDVEVSNFTVVDSVDTAAVITSVTTLDLSNSNLNDTVTISLDDNMIHPVWGFGLLNDNFYGEMIDAPMVEEKTVSDDLAYWTFRIKEGIKFSNGEPLTVSDIKFTYEFYMNEQNENQTEGFSILRDYIESIDIDENQNTITFKLRKAIFTTDVNVFNGIWILPEITIINGSKISNQTIQAYVKNHISSPVNYTSVKVYD